MASKLTKSPASTILPVTGGDTALVDLPKQGVQNYHLLLTAQAVVDITVAATRRRNRGSVWALFDQIVVEENGKRRFEIDGRILRFLSEMHAPSGLAATRLAAVGVQTTTIREQAILHFAHPLSASPQETVWRERDRTKKVQVGARVPLTAATIKNRLMEAGTATVTGIQLTVQQVYDDETLTPGLFIPTIRQVTLGIAGSDTKKELELKSSNWIRAIVIQQDSDAGEVGDIVKNAAFRGQAHNWIGEDQVPWDDLLRSMEHEFGGVVYTGPGVAIEQSAYYGMNFQQNGRLANIINPAELVNAKLVLDVQQTAAAGATPASSIVRVCLVELERPSGLVAPELPFPV